jgi:hypothetical protein
VARVAQVARVVVAVGPAQRQRHDVIDHGRQRRPPLGQAAFAQPVRSLQPPQPVALPRPPALSVCTWRS